MKSLSYFSVLTKIDSCYARSHTLLDAGLHRPIERTAHQL